jgi:hypothetical protein
MSASVEPTQAEQDVATREFWMKPKRRDIIRALIEGKRTGLVTDASIERFAKTIDMSEYCAAVRSHLIAELEQEGYPLNTNAGNHWPEYTHEKCETRMPVSEAVRGLPGWVINDCGNNPSKSAITSITVEEKSKKEVRIAWTYRKQPPSDAEQDEATDAFFEEHTNNNRDCAMALLYHQEKLLMTTDSIKRFAVRAEEKSLAREHAM